MADGNIVGGSRLLDANGDVIILADGMRLDSFKATAALIEAAPLLHELLLKAQWSGADPEDASRDVCPACGGVSRDHGGEGHTAACRIGTVLAQIEEASRG